MLKSNSANSISAKSSQPSLLMLCLLAAAISLFYVAITYSPGFLSGEGRYWQFRTDDSAIHLTGLSYFIRDSWRFPIFDVQGINYPEGSNIIFTDSIPLMAVAAKLLYKLTSVEWNILGFWTIVSNALLAVSSVFLLDGVKIRSYFLGFAASVMALCVFGYIYRSFHHVALSSVFLVIFALSFYFYALNLKKTKSSLTWLVVLLAVCLLIHLYLFVMVYAIFMVSLLTLWTKNMLPLKRAALWFAMSSLIIAIVILSAGYIHLDGSMKFNHGNMLRDGINIIEPFVPSMFSNFHYLVNKIKITQNINAGSGIGYLGCGVLLLWLFTFICYSKQLWFHIKSHKWLFLLLAAMFIFSLGSHVRFGNHIIFEYPMIFGIRQLFEMFNGTDRFFCPALYMASFVPLILMYRYSKRRQLTFLLIFAALLLQNLDVWKYRTIVRDQTNQPMTFNHLALLESLIPSYDMIVLEESSELLWKNGNYRTAVFAVNFVGGKYNITTNYSRAARSQKEILTFDELVRRTSLFNKKVLYILPERTFEDLPIKEKSVVATFDGVVLVQNGFK